MTIASSVGGGGEGSRSQGFTLLQHVGVATVFFSQQLLYILPVSRQPTCWKRPPLVFPGETLVLQLTTGLHNIMLGSWHGVFSLGTKIWPIPFFTSICVAFANVWNPLQDRGTPYRRVLGKCVVQTPPDPLTRPHASRRSWTIRMEWRELEAFLEEKWSLDSYTNIYIYIHLVFLIWGKDEYLNKMFFEDGISPKT